MHYNFRHLISLKRVTNKKVDTPVYIQLFNALKTSVINGEIPTNTKLPPTRILAKDLSISRSTVIKSYELLVLENFFYSKKGSGYFVKYLPKKKEITKINSHNRPKISKSARNFLKHKYVSTDDFSRNIAFRPGLPPLDIFPITKWKKLSNDYWQNSTPSQLSYAPTDGMISFKEEIANYLKIYRGIYCSSFQVIITTGSIHSLFLAANTLLNPRDSVAIENPTFPRAYKMLKSMKANMIACDVDSEGMTLNAVKKTGIKLFYSTPSNQYPLGIQMSLERRKELIHTASKKNAIIIEDDYDHEFSNSMNSIPSLFSLDKEDRVIYMGTFNKLMHPSLRLGYMIAPNYLVPAIKAIYEQSSRFVSPDRQTIMKDFIKSDALNKHLRKVFEVAHERRILFKKLARKSLTFKESNLGLHLIGKPKANINDKKLFEILLKKHVIAYPLSNYYIGNTNEQGLVFGFSSVNEKMMKEKIDIINKLLI